MTETCPPPPAPFGWRVRLVPAAPRTSARSPPAPRPGFCTEAVLVETFEPGRSVAHHIRHPHRANTQIVALGVDTYLKCAPAPALLLLEALPPLALPARPAASALPAS